VSITCGGKPVDKVTRGGTFGVETLLDPYVTKSDKFSGNVAGLPGKLPPVVNKLALEVHLLDRVVGSKEELKVDPLHMNENLMLNVGTSTTLGTVVSTNKKGRFELALKLAVCIRQNKRVTIARRFGTRWRLIGYGIVQ
jgi:translation initiation factor 2 subunit 3